MDWNRGFAAVVTTSLTQEERLYRLKDVGLCEEERCPNNTTGEDLMSRSTTGVHGVCYMTSHLKVRDDRG